MDYGLETLEDVAHAFGDIQQAIPEKELWKIFKRIEGNWDATVLDLNENGTPKRGAYIGDPQAEETDRTDAMYSPLMKFGKGISHKIVGKWNNMIFHARQATIHAESQRFKNGEDGSAPKITEQERQDRRLKMHDAWKEYVPGIMIRAQCPGRRTEDEFYTAVWKDRITEYPDLERCTSEDQEAEAENNRKKEMQIR